MKNAIVNGKEIEEKAISDIIEELARIDRECNRTEAAHYLGEVAHEAGKLAIYHARMARQPAEIEG